MKGHVLFSTLYGHFLPPPLGCTSTCLVLCCTAPTPHVLLHADQSDHVDIRQSRFWFLSSRAHRILHFLWRISSFGHGFPSFIGKTWEHLHFYISLNCSIKSTPRSGQDENKWLDSLKRELSKVIAIFKWKERIQCNKRSRLLEFVLNRKRSFCIDLSFQHLFMNSPLSIHNLLFDCKRRTDFTNLSAYC